MAFMGLMAPMKAKTFVETVRARLPDLSPTERRLADLLLDFPGELASYTASELADMAGVSNATVTRFIRRVGYRSYEAARQQVRVDRQSGAALYLVKPPSETAGELAAQQRQAVLNLDQTFSKLSHAEIEAAANAVVGARRVLLIGSRAGRALADYLAFQLVQVIDTVSVAPPAGETLGETLAALGSQDCVILFRLKRPSQQFEKVVRAVRGSGARIIYITDDGTARRSDVNWHLQCKTTALGPVFNHVAVMAVCHLFASCAFAAAGPAGRKRMRDVEAAHQALNDV